MLVISHNIDEPRDPRDAALALKSATWEREPEVYVLQECRGAKRAFVDVFGEKYRVLMSDARGASLITMVRDDLRISGERYIHMEREWIGPKQGLRQPPRIHNLTDVEGGFRIYNVHRVWMPKDQSRGLSSVAQYNHAAWVEEHRAIRRVFAKPRSKRRITMCVGDQNSVVFDRSGYSVHRLAQEVDAKIIRTGAAVDWAFVAGGEGEGQAHERVGSDHPYVSVRVWE
jgi:hypothetical protein